jgi:hypothetical protein
LTFPARQYSVNGERRSFALLRPASANGTTDRLRDHILAAYAEHIKQPETTLTHLFDFRGQAACGSSNDEDGDAPATHDRAAVTCEPCKAIAAAQKNEDSMTKAACALSEHPTIPADARPAVADYLATGTPAAERAMTAALDRSLF